MNPVAKEIEEYILCHYGMPRRSGRYPWGSGEDPYQRTSDFLGRIEALKKDGWEETPENIKEAFGITTTDYRTMKTVAKDQRRMYQVARAKSLAEDGKGASEIGREMGVRESTVRSWLNAESEARMLAARKTADFIKEQIDKKGMVEVGKGMELELNISENKLTEALAILDLEGYPTYSGRVPQPTNPSQSTTITVACPPGYKHKDIYQTDKINTLNEYISRDGGDTYEKKFTYPTSLDSSRLKIRYNEEGGELKDGVIELRRGVQDLDLKGSNYAQVRIMVDGTHYLKGMAVYSDDLPKGVDVMFNTNKRLGTDMKDVLKEIKKDPDNPFGSLIKDADQGGQYWYNDKQTGEKKLGLINKRSDQGDWSEWADKLPSQFLSKQSKAMAEKQLGLAIADKKAEYDAICELTNPTVKKNLLESFASDCDSAAVHLQAAALPGQKYHAIMPLNSLKDTEVYAPNYADGTKLALIRYPHGGTFEIPVLTVNNKNALARKLLGVHAQDAIAITKKNADILSGADFDGDTVMCIPTDDKYGNVKISRRPPLDGLKGFEGKDVYGASDVKVDADGTKHYYRNGIEYPLMSKSYTQKQMGVVSNLICDMTLRGAQDDELAAAVRHSMVVIDAAKHKLDYKASEIDNNIAALKKKYQDGGGASTLISRAKGEATVDKRQGMPRVNLKDKEWYDPSRPEGALVYKTNENLEYDTAKVYKKAKGDLNGTVHVSKKGTRYIQFDGDDPNDWVPIKGKSTLEDGARVYAIRETQKRTQKSTQMAETDDARTLISKARTPMELVYADYANTMKNMANQARIEKASTGKIAYNPQAAKTYASEVTELEKKLKNSQINAPRERMATILANAEISAKKESNPGMTKEEIKKISQQAISKYRQQVGSVNRKDRNIDITPKEWEAIQAGAIHESKLMQILNSTDSDVIRKYATPRAANELSTAQISRMQNLADRNYTLDEIAKKLGCSTSTVSKYLKGAK